MSVPRPSPDLPQDSGAYTPAQAPYTASAYPGGAPAASPSPASWHQIVLYAVPVLALLGLISTFLPVATVTIGDESHSANYWSDSVDAKGEAILLLILFLVATGLGVAAAVRRLRPLLITTGAISAIAGIFGTIDGFGNLGNYSDDDLDLRGFIETDPGIGTYLLAFAGLFLIIGGILQIIIGAVTKPTATAPVMLAGGYGMPDASAPGQPGQYGAQPAPYQQPGYGTQPPYQG
ncbi:hypothetical protein [Actinomyces timonensis]|uniref:hypothetical protein n=1 Tax=Actinomyces timonensis TaxID=1288391 RepID=UPI0002DD65B0|nr:hypothetical protein [Actinomyces timonensis]